MDTNTVALSNIAMLYELTDRHDLPIPKAFDVCFTASLAEAQRNPKKGNQLSAAIDAAKQYRLTCRQKYPSLSKQESVQELLRHQIKLDPMRLRVRPDDFDEFSRNLQAEKQIWFKLPLIRLFNATQSFKNQFMPFFAKLVDCATFRKETFSFQTLASIEMLFALCEILDKKRSHNQDVNYDEFHETQQKLLTLIVSGDMDDETELRQYLIQQLSCSLLQFTIAMEGIEGFCIDSPLGSVVCNSCPSTTSVSSSTTVARSIQ